MKSWILRAGRNFDLVRSCRDAGKTVVFCGYVCACSVAQSFPALCESMNYSPSGSSVHGIFQARILEGVSISSSRESSQPRDRTCISYVSCIGRQILYHFTTWEASGRLCRVRVKPYLFLILKIHA